MRWLVNTFSFPLHTIRFYCSQFLFISSTESARTTALLCIPLTLYIHYCCVNLRPPAVCPQAQLTSACSIRRESLHNHWFPHIQYTHIYSINVFLYVAHKHTHTHPRCAESGFSRAASDIFVSEIHTLTHTHARCKYRCWCLRLVAALKLAHICSCIDPSALCCKLCVGKGCVCVCVCVCVCSSVCAGHTVYHTSCHLCDAVQGGEVFPALSPAIWHHMTLAALHVCAPVSAYLCVWVCVCVCVCVSEWSLSPLAQMPRLNPSPAVLHSGAKLEHLAPS